MKAIIPLIVFVFGLLAVNAMLNALAYVVFGVVLFRLAQFIGYALVAAGAIYGGLMLLTALGVGTAELWRRKPKILISLACVGTLVPAIWANIGNRPPVGPPLQLSTWTSKPFFGTQKFVNFRNDSGADLHDVRAVLEFGYDKMRFDQKVSSECWKTGENIQISLLQVEKELKMYDLRGEAFVVDSITGKRVRRKIATIHYFTP